MDSLLIVNGKGPGNERTVGIVGWFFAGFNLADTILAISQSFRSNPDVKLRGEIGRSLNDLLKLG